jgi:amidase
MSDIAFLAATELARMVRNREISCVELLQHYLDRADRFNGELNAIVVDIREQALVDARRADEAVACGAELGPLHGVPMTVKEAYNVAGTPTTWGNPNWLGNVPDTDAVVIRKLKQAGVIIFGKTNVPLMLGDFQSYNDIYGTSNNPYDLSRTPGGSSGGAAAALAAGLTGIESGSDIGGSIRNPAHYCGVFGHKPTHDLIWMRGYCPPGVHYARPDISVVGPMARSAGDLAVSLKVMASPDDIKARGFQWHLPDLGGRKLGDLKVAVWKDSDLCPVSNEVSTRVEAVADAFRAAGAVVDENARPDIDVSRSSETFALLLNATLSSRLPEEIYGSLQAGAALLDPGDQRPEAKNLRAQVATFRQWSQANEFRHQMRWQWHAFFEDFDILIAPIMPTAAFLHDHRDFSERSIRVDEIEMPYFDQVFWAGLTGVSYLPSTAIPTGLNTEGLPVGVQIVGPEYGDLITIGVAQLLEDAGFCFEPPEEFI